MISNRPAPESAFFVRSSPSGECPSDTPNTSMGLATSLRTVLYSKKPSPSFSFAMVRARSARRYRMAVSTAIPSLTKARPRLHVALWP